MNLDETIPYWASLLDEVFARSYMVMTGVGSYLQLASLNFCDHKKTEEKSIGS